MIVESLAGKRVAVTGATGFLGTALVERLLRCVPDCTVVPVIRPSRRASAEQRARREIVRNDCFDRLRSEWGDRFDGQIDRRLDVIAGDVGVDGLALDAAGRAALAACDVVVHSAATVSFDAALDAAVEVNLLGPSRVASVLEETATEGAGSAGDPYLVSVSTAYVAGRRPGEAPERPLADTPFSIEVDWRAEVGAARRVRADADAASRSPEQLAKFMRAARRDLGAAGTHLLSERSEKMREEWVRNRLVEAGRARAQSLGWPDAYAYTKALGERALLDQHPDLALTIVRPSIIESAVDEPAPGWIRGFRMAEPIIISYARGLLREFPGLPEGVIDVIPVDLVVAAVIAAAADRPQPGDRRILQVASGMRNPLSYGRLVNLAQEWFSANPLYDEKGQPIVVPEWSFPGRGRVTRQLQRSERALALVERVLTTLPVRGRQAQLSGTVEQKRSLAERALSYVTLYGAYTETEARFAVGELIAAYGRLDERDKAAFCFDPAVVDWDHYVTAIHLPSVVAHARVRTTPGGRSVASRAERAKRALLSPSRQLAAFDLENTLIAANVVDSYAWLATRRLPRDDQVRLALRMFRQAPGLLALDKRDRGDFLRHFYRRYDGAPAELVRADAWEMYAQLLALKSFPAGLRRVREHRALGHRTILITGALDFVVAPLRPLFDEIVSARLEERDGYFTGGLVDAPPTGEARALLLASYAQAEGLDLTESIAYADSASDLPLLEAVGFPVAVNPEAKLATIARKRGWHVEIWQKAPGGPRPLLPTAQTLFGRRSAETRVAARSAITGNAAHDSTGTDPSR